MRAGCEQIGASYQGWAGNQRKISAPAKNRYLAIDNFMYAPFRTVKTAVTRHFLGEEPENARRLRYNISGAKISGLFCRKILLTSRQVILIIKSRMKTKSYKYCQRKDGRGAKWIENW